MCGYCLILGIASGLVAASAGMWFLDRWADAQLARAPEPVPVAARVEVAPPQPVQWHCHLHGPVVVFHLELDMVEHMARFHPNLRRFGDWWIQAAATAVPKA
jgi:hypothetical protein